MLIEPNGTVSLSVVLTDRLEKLTLAVQDKEEKPLSGVAVYVDGALRGTAPGAFLLPVCVGAVTLAKDGFADAPIKIDLREPKKLTVKMGTTGKPSPLLSGVVASKRRPEAPKELPAVAIVPTEPLAADRRAVEPAESPSRVSAAETGKIPSAPPSGGFKEFRARFPYFWYGIGIASGGLLTALGGIVCNHFADTKYDEYESLSNEDRILEEMAKPGFDRDVYLARIDRAKSDGDDLVWARNGLYIAGAAIFAGGVVLAFFPALDDEKKKVSFRFAPGYLPGGAGVSFLLSY